MFCVTLSRFHSYHSQIRRSEFSDCFFGRSDVCPDTMWGDVFALWFSHLWKIYIGSINSWLAVRTFSLTLVCLRDFASVCATRMSTLNWSWYFEKWISDNTYIFPEDCSNHLDEKIFCPLQDIKDFKHISRVASPQQEMTQILEQNIDMLIQCFHIKY